MRHLLFSLLVLSYLVSFPQSSPNQRNPKIDSLKAVIEETSVDTLKVIKYLELGTQYLSLDQDSAYLFYKKSLDLAFQKRFVKGINNAYSYLAYLAGLSASDDSAKLVHKQAIDILES